MYKHMHKTHEDELESLSFNPTMGMRDRSYVCTETNMHTELNTLIYAPRLKEQLFVESDSIFFF